MYAFFYLFSLSRFLKNALIGLIICFSVNAYSQVFVTPSGAGASNGTSWANAYSASQLRNALRSATAGSEFWVAAGTYFPGTVRDSFLYIKSGVKVFGGFNGTETTLSARDWETNETILSGDIGVLGDSTDNSIHVVVFDQNSIDSSTLLDGFTITRGNATPDYGGGIYINTRWGTGNGYPVIKHCKITHNTAKYGAGGIYAYSYGFPTTNLRLTIDSCVFEYNHCDSATNRAGGGLLCEADNMSTNTLLMSDCSFSNNSSNAYGGGLEIRNSSGKSYVTMEKCNFHNNSAQLGGAIGLISYNDYSGTGGVFNISIDSCFFDGNISTSTQGGAVFSNISYPFVPVLNISNSTFYNNHSLNAGAIGVFTGAHLETVNAINTFNNDVFRLNTATYGNYGAYDIQSTYGGYDTTRFINCLFDRNRGGTVDNRASEDGKNYIEFINCTIYDDSSTAVTSYPNGIIHSEPNKTSLYPNPWVTTVFKNGIIYWPDPASTVAFGHGLNSTTIISNSIVKGSGGSGIGWAATLGVDSGGNKDVYPRFCDTANYNFNLRCISPAKDSGNNSFISPYTSWSDLNGDSRIYSSVVDLGCFEFNAIPPAILPEITSETGSLVVTVNNLTTGQEDSVEWDFGDGFLSKYYNVTHTYATAGTYTICLHVFSCLGNADSCVTITLTNTLGATTLPAPEYTVYPNPTAHELSIKGITQKSDYSVNTLMGTVVRTGVLMPGTNVINMDSLPPGFYLLQVYGADGKKNITKVMKL